MKTSTLYLIIFSIILLSCGDKDENNRYNTSTLTSSTWIEKTAYKFNGNWYNSTGLVDVIYQFNANGNGIKTITTLVPTGTPIGSLFGGIVFNDLEPMNTPIDFKWNLSSNGVLIIDETATGKSYNWEITEYTADVIKTKAIEGQVELPILSKWSTIKAEGLMTVFEKKD
jgi:hypothetical protein